MRWISRYSHQEIVGILREQIDLLRSQLDAASADRRLLVDRLAGRGLITTTEPPQDDAEGAIEPEELADPEGDLLSSLMQFRNRPTQLATALTNLGIPRRRAERQVAWLPETPTPANAMQEALSQVEKAVKG